MIHPQFTVAHPVDLDDEELEQLQDASTAAATNTLERLGPEYVVQRLLADLARARAAVDAFHELPPAALDVLHERIRQDRKWGEQNHPDGTGLTARPLADLAHRKAAFGWSSVHAMTAPALAAAATENTNVAFAQDQGTWADILLEEVFEALAAADPAKLRHELIQVAAVAQAWVEDIDRRAVQS